MKASHPTRVLTCCYCGARSTLPPRERHALVCHGCGAPISRIEEIQPELERRRRSPGAPGLAVPHPADRKGGHKPHDRPARRRKGKRRKDGLWARLGDRVEDLFDILDLD